MRSGTFHIGQQYRLCHAATRGVLGRLHYRLMSTGDLVNVNRMQRQRNPWPVPHCLVPKVWHPDDTLESNHCFPLLQGGMYVYWDLGIRYPSSSMMNPGASSAPSQRARGNEKSKMKKRKKKKREEGRKWMSCVTNVGYCFKKSRKPGSHEPSD